MVPLDVECVEENHPDEGGSLTLQMSTISINSYRDTSTIVTDRYSDNADWPR